MFTFQMSYFVLLKLTFWHFFIYKSIPPHAARQHVITELCTHSLRPEHCPHVVKIPCIIFTSAFLLKDFNLCLLEWSEKLEKFIFSNKELEQPRCHFGNFFVHLKKIQFVENSKQKCKLFTRRRVTHYVSYLLPSYLP